MTKNKKKKYCVRLEASDFTISLTNDYGCRDGYGFRNENGLYYWDRAGNGYGDGYEYGNRDADGFGTGLGYFIIEEQEDEEGK